MGNSDSTTLPKATLTSEPNPVFPGRDSYSDVFSRGLTVAGAISGRDPVQIHKINHRLSGLSHPEWFRCSISLPRLRCVGILVMSPFLLVSIMMTVKCCRARGAAKAVLTIHPNSSQILSGESVTLRCDIQGGGVTGWDSAQSYPGETVTLTCSVGSDSSWSYQWYKDRNDNVVSQSSYSNIGVSHTISRAGVSDQGQYWCEGNRVSRPTSSLPSDPVTLTVKDSRPTATLSLDQANVFTGDSVTLTCTVESYGWKFYWYRHRPDSTPVTSTSGYSYTLSRVSVSDGGQYWCRAGTGDPVYYTLYTDPVQIHFTVPPGSIVTISLPRPLCGLLVVSPFLLVSIVLTVKCCRARGLCSTVKSPQDQIQCDDVIEQNESSV
ncbi:hypothetical protein J4Q44_G00377010 [Coregonus suidteri]|uniref:Ig-like domain-containing protein n=1 Tax=Coregonus suidteri TaxID=861788 RepID=A0AAN8KN35_9TELE